MLEAVGLSGTDDAVYHVLLEAVRARLETLVELSGLPRAEVAESLRRLVDHGLVQPDQFNECGYIALSPDVAIPVLIDRRRRELTALQVRVDQLAEARRARPVSDAPVVEPVRGLLNVLSTAGRIQAEAETELLLIDAPPYLATGVAMPNDAELTSLARGVSYRAIYHPDALADTDAVDHMRRCVAAGEQARVLAGAGPKLMIADRRVALLLESNTAPDSAARLLVRESALLDLIVERFEHMWSAAVPVDGDASGEAAEVGVSERDRQLLALLAAGMKDRTIARTLGVTERTVGRRVTELMQRLDADTRFRAGVRAVARGWISAE